MIAINMIGLIWDGGAYLLFKAFMSKVVCHASVLVAFEYRLGGIAHQAPSPLLHPRLWLKQAWRMC